MKKILLFILLSGSLQIHAQFFENFDSVFAIPQGWKIADNGTGPTSSWEMDLIYTSYSEPNAVFCNRENIGANNTSEDWLVTPLISLSENAVLHFYSRQTLVGNNGTLFHLKISTQSQDNHDSFINLATWDEEQLAVSGEYLSYHQIDVPLADYAGQMVYIAFVRSHTQIGLLTEGDRWLIDDVSVENGVLKRKDLTTDLFSVYPNPANDVLQLRAKTDNQILGATVYNPIGQNVLTSFGESEINISRLVSGTYFITVETEIGKSTHKFIKL